MTERIGSRSSLVARGASLLAATLAGSAAAVYLSVAWTNANQDRPVWAALGTAALLGALAGVRLALRWRHLGVKHRLLHALALVTLAAPGLMLLIAFSLKPP